MFSFPCYKLPFHYLDHWFLGVASPRISLDWETKEFERESNRVTMQKVLCCPKEGNANVYPIYVTLVDINP